MKTIGLVTRSAGIATAILCALPLAAAAADMSTNAGTAPPPAAHAMQPAAKSAGPAMKPAATAHMSRSAHRQLIMNVQEALNRHGAGLKADGIDGPKTRRALRDYQAANKLARTGKIDAATRKSLGLG